MKNKIIIIVVCFILFLGLPLNSFSQDRAYINKLTQALDTVKNENLKGKMYYSIGFKYKNINLDSSEYFLKKAIKIYEELNAYREYGNAVNLLAMVYQSQGELLKAMQIINKILPSVIARNDLVLQADCKKLLGELNRGANNFEIAIGLIKEAIVIYKQINDEAFYAESQNRLSAIYYELKNYELAIVYADSSLIIYEKRNNINFIINNLDIKAACYSSLLQHEKALIIYNKIILLSNKNNIELGANIIRNIADIHFKLENYPQAIQYALQAFEDAKQKGIKIYIKQLAVILSKAYEQTNDYKKAYKYAVISKGFGDDILDEQKNKQIAELNTKYETEKKQNKINQQKKELFNKEIKLKQRQNISLLLLITILLTIVIIILTVKNRIKQKKINVELKKLFNYKELLIAMIVHDLKNPISLILSLSKNKEIISLSKFMLNMVSNMLDIQKHENEKMIINPVSNSLYMLSHNAVLQIELLASNKDIEIKNNVDNDIFVETDIEVTKRIIVNLLTNAIKYSHKNSSISLNSRKLQNSDFVKIEITDYGIGIDKDKLKTVFNKFSQIIARKSGGVRSTGLGLTFCKIATEAHGGEINVSSIPNKETTFAFTLPTSKKVVAHKDTKIVLNKKEELKLLNKDKIYLQQFVTEYKKYDIYDIVPLRNITADINEDFSENIKTWKQEMQKAVYNTNETKFKDMLKNI